MAVDPIGAATRLISLDSRPYSGRGSDARIFSTRAQYLFALNARTGQPIADFGDGGKVDLDVGLGPLMKAFRWSGVPLPVRDVVVTTPVR